MSPLLGLTERDFDAYLPERASSNVYSRPRLEFKQRALGWVRSVISRLRDINISVDVHASDEHPSVWNSHRVDCQWVFLWRDRAARAELDALLDQRQGLAQSLHDPSPFFRHAFLALRLDSEKIEVCTQLHPGAWVDFETLHARLADPDRAAGIVQAIEALPEQFELGLEGEPKQPCSPISRDLIAPLLARSATEGRALWIGWSVAREVAIEHSALLDEQLQDALIALAPVYQHIAWSSADDPAQVQARLAEMREELTKAAAERAAELERQRAETLRQRRETTQQSRERTRERIDYAAAPRVRPSLGNLFKPDLPADTRAGAPPSAPRAQGPGSHREPPRSSRSQPSEIRAAPQPRSAERFAPLRFDDSSEPVDKGTRVRVLAGPFAGKVGVVSEIDTRGMARVLLGLLSTRVAVTQLSAVVEAKDRPALHASHRRPSPLGRSGNR